jgi:hypothetical protein
MGAGTGNRRLKTEAEDRGQKTEDGGPKTED